MSRERSHSPEGQLELLRGEVRELREENERLQELAMKDELTGAYNRRGFEEIIGKLLPEDAGKRAPEEAPRKPLTFLYFDIDGFKELNDRYGHTGGDQILRAFAAHVSGSIRKKDVFARWGGEEFVVAFQKATEQDVLSKFYNPERGTSELAVDLEIQDQKLRVSASGGVTSFRSGDDLATVIARADGALYRAKQGGKDHLLRFDDEKTGAAS